MANSSTQITVRANPDLDDCLAGASAEYIEEHPELAGYDLSPQWGDDDRETVTLTLPAHCRAVDDGDGGDGGGAVTSKFTLEFVKNLRPCYSDDQISELSDDRTELSYAEVLELPISAADLLWLLWRGPDAEITASALERTISRCIATHAIRCGIAPVEAWARAWVTGADRSQESAGAAWSAWTSPAVWTVSDATEWTPWAAAAAWSVAVMVSARSESERAEAVELAARSAARAAVALVGASEEFEQLQDFRTILLHL